MDAAYTTRLPLGANNSDSFVYTDSTTDFRPTNQAGDAKFFTVSPDYFSTAQTKLLAGRSFTVHDAAKNPLVAVVNREFVRKVLGTTTNQAVGAHFKT